MNPPHVRDFFTPQEDVFLRVKEDSEYDRVLVVDHSADCESLEPQEVTYDLDGVQRGAIGHVPIPSTWRQGLGMQGFMGASIFYKTV